MGGTVPTRRSDHARRKWEPESLEDPGPNCNIGASHGLQPGTLTCGSAALSHIMCCRVTVPNEQEEQRGTGRQRQTVAREAGGFISRWDSWSPYSSAADMRKHGVGSLIITHTPPVIKLSFSQLLPSSVRISLSQYIGVQF